MLTYKLPARLQQPATTATGMTGIRDYDAMSQCSVAVALAGVFAILINKIYKIMEIFE